MHARWTMAAILAASWPVASAFAQSRPPESFVVCPGHPRCPRFEAPAPSPPPPEPAPAIAPPTSERPGTYYVNLRDGPPDQVYFDTGSHALDDRARRILGEHARLLRASGIAVSIEGHADARGSREANLALGARRAEAVRAYLVAQGVPADRIETMSYGEERPAVVDEGEQVWMLNRRVRIAPSR